MLKIYIKWNCLGWFTLKNDEKNDTYLLCYSKRDHKREDTILFLLLNRNGGAGRGRCITVLSWPLDPGLERLTSDTDVSGKEEESQRMWLRQIINNYATEISKLAHLNLHLWVQLKHLIKWAILEWGSPIPGAVRPWDFCDSIPSLVPSTYGMGSMVFGFYIKIQTNGSFRLYGAFSDI